MLASSDQHGLPQKRPLQSLPLPSFSGASDRKCIDKKKHVRLIDQHQPMPKESFSPVVSKPWTPDWAPLRRAMELVEQKRNVLVEQKRNMQDKGSNSTLSPETRLIHRAMRGDPTERNNVLVEQELMKSSKERIDHYFKYKAKQYLCNERHLHQFDSTWTKKQDGHYKVLCGFIAEKEQFPTSILDSERIEYAPLNQSARVFLVPPIKDDDTLQTMKQSHDKLLQASVDINCMSCDRIFEKPVSGSEIGGFGAPFKLHCGHTMCELCTRKSWQCNSSKYMCSLCGQLSNTIQYDDCTHHRVLERFQLLEQSNLAFNCDRVVMSWSFYDLHGKCNRYRKNHELRVDHEQPTLSVTQTQPSELKASFQPPISVAMQIKNGRFEYTVFSKSRSTFGHEFRLTHCSQLQKIQNNDKLLAVNDIPVTFLCKSQLIKMIQNDYNTDIQFTLRRSREPKAEDDIRFGDTYIVTLRTKQISFTNETETHV